nr:helix-turn-helix transcriptional regulator [uncultured Blautia sp.]
MLTAKRNEKQLTKKQTAELLGVTPMYYARFENNNLTPSRRNLDFFASFLEMDKEELWLIIEEEKKTK